MKIGVCLNCSKIKKFIKFKKQTYMLCRKCYDEMLDEYPRKAILKTARHFEKERERKFSTHLATGRYKYGSD